MNKITLLIITILCFIIFSSIAYASASISKPNSVYFGLVDWDASASETFTITNNGDVDLNNLQITSTANSKYNVSISPNQINLSIGESKSINVDMHLKYDKNDKAGNISLGNIVISGSTLSSVNIPAYFSAEWLQVRDLSVKVGSESDSDLENGNKIDKKAKPGDDILFSIELENLFDSDDDEYIIEDVYAEVTIKEIDDGDDIKGKTERFTINPGAIKTNTIILKVPDVVKSGNYDVTVKIDGDNAETNENYKIEWNLELEVEKRKNDVQIRKYEFDPSVLECGQLQTTLYLELKNFGESAEDQVTLEIKNSDLNLNEQFTSINLGTDYDDDATYTKDIQILLDDDLVDPGTYPITINVYFDNDKLDDQKTTNIELKDCNEQEPVVEQNASSEVFEEVQEQVVEQENQSMEETIETKPIMKFIAKMPSITIGESVKGISYYLPILVFLIIIGVIVIIALLIVVLKK